jgi:predicted GIY-YIG superfamily endonuclease
MIQGCIYVIIDPDGYYYYGSTVNLHKRLLSHYHCFTKGKLFKVYNQFRKFDWDDLIVTIVEETEFQTRQELFNLEREYIIKAIADPLCLNSF